MHCVCPQGCGADQPYPGAAGGEAERGREEHPHEHQTEDERSQGAPGCTQKRLQGADGAFPG